MKKENSKIYQKLEGLKAPIDKESIWSQIQPYTKPTPIAPKWYQLSLKSLLIGVPIVAISTFLLVLSIQKEDSNHISNAKSVATSQSIENSRSVISDNSISNTAIPQESSNNNSSISKIDNAIIQNDDVEITSSIEPENRIDIFQRSTSNAINSNSNIPISSSDKVINDKNSFVNSEVEMIGPLDQDLVSKEAIKKDFKNENYENSISTHGAKTQFQDSKLNGSMANEISRKQEEEVSKIDSRWTSIIPNKYTLENPTIDLDLQSSENKWSLGVRLGLGYGNISRSLIGVEADSWTKTLMDNTKPIQSYHFDFYLQRKIYNNWSLRLGIDYSRYHDRLIYSDSETTYRKNDSGIDQSLFTSESTTSNYKLFQKYSFVNLSLSASRSFNWSSWSLIPSIGIVYNQQFSQNGNTLDEQSTSTKLADAYEYVQTLPLRYQLGVSFQKYINKSVNMDLNLMYRPNATITSAENSLQLNAGGLSVGIGFQYKW